jgi:rRNA processing protein Gar1
LQEAATVLHLARSGRLILKATTSALPREGSILVDEKGRRVAKVLEIIGPVASPYLSTQPLTDRIERSSKTKLYLSEESASEDKFKDKKFRGPRDDQRNRNSSPSGNRRR